MDEINSYKKCVKFCDQEDIFDSWEQEFEFEFMIFRYFREFRYFRDSKYTCLMLGNRNASCNNLLA